MHSSRVTFDGQPLRPMPTASSFDETPTRMGRVKAACRQASDECRRATKTTALCCCITVFLTVVVMSVTVGTAIVSPWINHQDAIAAAMILPTMKRWNTFLDCVRDEGCNLCEQPLILKMQPATETRVAIVGIQGSGATWVRGLVQAGTRIMAGSEDCFMMHQWGKPWSLRDAPFKSECAGPFFFSHHSMIRFNHVREWTRHAYYMPTHFVFVTRNPFESIISAFHYYRRCGGATTIMCSTLSAPITDFQGPEWVNYIDEHLSEWLEFRDLVKATSEPKVIIDYADMQSNTESSMVRVFDFLREAEHESDKGILASTSRSSACAASDTHSALTKRPQIVDPHKVFTPELRAKVCSVVVDWDPKWGTNWCV